METKRCPRCSINKPLEEFRVGKSIMGYCKVCWNSYQRELYQLRKIPPDFKYCPICRSQARLVLDHSNKRTRGKLCRRCNTGLAMFRDSIPNLVAAIEYLKVTRE